MEVRTINNRIKILVKANSPKNEITSYDAENEAYRVNIKAPPEKGKANLEVVKFFSKLLKKRVWIVYGLKSRKKIVEVG